ncbi:hypothetical protein PsYK624_136570 [Phanerochaete sordida]|uniref:Uncharacterized protein n=1 Tax=Phanerochaete sordida TaxID=48140 RepID=A0A9P3LJK2_9APHY|nr:hypothetical protein PsYK624_136570 [Phanerochaete sordida]
MSSSTSLRGEHRKTSLITEKRYPLPVEIIHRITYAPRSDRAPGQLIYPSGRRQNLACHVASLSTSEQIGPQATACSCCRQGEGER